MTAILNDVGPKTFSANADWVRALQRTSSITPRSQRTLATAIAEKARDQETRPAFEDTQGSLTYTELAARANQYARWGLQLGLGKGDRVALLLANQADYAAVWIGLGQIGVVTALLNTQMVGESLAHGLKTADTGHLIFGARFAEAIAPIPFEGKYWIHGGVMPGTDSVEAALGQLSDAPLNDAELDRDVVLQDPALLIFTSGTTGAPKAAYVSHFRVMMWSEWFAGIIDATPEDRLYNCLPMYHSVGGVVAVGAMLVAGGTVIVREAFSVTSFWSDLIASGATIFQYIGELCRYLVGTSTQDTVIPEHKLRLCIGNGLRSDVWDGFVERFAIPRVIEFYAATEGSFSLFNVEGRPGAIGRIPRFISHRSPVALVAFDHENERPARGAEGFCRRAAPGEIGEAIGRITRESTALSARFEGYTSPIETERKILRNVFEPGDMWFRTGDLMRQDKAGFFYFVDRIGDTFRWKGENISASEVAEVIASCAGIRDAAVYGVAVPHSDGRAGMATIVVGADFDLAALRRHLAASLPRAARPLFLRIRDAMALTGTFKQKKQDFVEDGFDPDRVVDRLYLDDPAARAYVPVDQALFARISSGAVKL